MQIENNKEEVPFSYYENLFSRLDPIEAAQRTGVNWDGKNFYMELMHFSYIISHPECTVRKLEDGSVPPLPVQTFLLRFLLEGKKVDWTGQWKTFREMPWGEMYIKPYTGRVLTRAAFTFGTRIEAFRAACEKIGGVKLPHGDAGFQFHFLRGYDIQLLVWEGDEEFPPNAQVIYSDNFAEGFAAEDRVVAGDILISTIKSYM